MRFAKALAASVWMVMLPMAAWAQPAETEGTEAEAAAAEPAEDEASAEGGEAAAAETDDGRPKNVSASGYATTEQPFKVRRGWSVEGELGVFMTLGGRDANDLPGRFPSTGISEASPYAAVIIGYDVVDTDAFALSVGPKFGVAFNSGSAQLGSDFASSPDPTVAARANTFANDYAAYEVGLNISGIIMVAERLAIPIKLSGGATFVDSNPFVDFCGGSTIQESPPANIIEGCADTDAGNVAIGGVFGASAGIEWYTLLNGFSVGVQVRFQGLLLDDFISGIAIPATLKYTF